MTREELIEILRDFDNYETLTYDTTADRILAALEKEREGEVVLEEGRMAFRCDQCGIVSTLGADSITKENRERDNKRCLGKLGQLIFRPTPADKEGGI